MVTDIHSAHKRPNQKGFTLLELLLGVAIFGGILYAITMIMQDYAKRELARGTAQYMETAARGVQETLTNDLNNFLALYNNILTLYGTDVAGGRLACTGGAICAVEYDLAGAGFNFRDGGTVSFNDGATTINVTIPKNTVINEGFRAENPLKSDVRVILSIADDPNNADTPPALHMMVVSLERAPDEYVRYAASEAGNSGGWYRNAGDPIESAYAAWEFPIGLFHDTTIAAGDWNDIITTDTPDPADEGTYLVYYAYLNYADSSGDYLYREEQTNVELHTMYSSLNMGNNDIVGADNIVATEEFNATNQIIVQGSTHVANNLSLNAGSLISDGTANVNAVNIDSAGLANANSFLGDGNITITNAMLMEETGGARGRIDAETGVLRDVVVDELDVAQDSRPNTGRAEIMQTVTFNGQGRSSFNNFSLNGALDNPLNMSDDLQSQSMNIGGTLNIPGPIGILQVRSEDTGPGIDIDVTGSFNAPQISLDVLDLSSGEFGICDLGCGN